jgi:hypothetical protein
MLLGMVTDLPHTIRGGLIALQSKKHPAYFAESQHSEREQPWFGTTELLGSILCACYRASVVYTRKLGGRGHGHVMHSIPGRQRLKQRRNDCSTNPTPSYHAIFFFFFRPLPSYPGPSKWP